MHENHGRGFGRTILGGITKRFTRAAGDTPAADPCIGRCSAAWRNFRNGERVDTGRELRAPRKTSRRL